MNQVDYLHQLDTGSLTLEEKLEIKGLGVHQPQDVGRNQTTDVHQLIVIKEEFPWSPGLEEQDLYVKEEQEEFWSSQEGEQLHGLEEADVTSFPFTVVHVKSEDDEEEPQSSQLQVPNWIQTDRDADLPEPNSHFQTNTDPETSDSPETDVSEDEWQEPLSDPGSDAEVTDGGWKEVGLSESGVKPDETSNGAKKTFSCSECGKRFLYKQSLQRHMTHNSCSGQKQSEDSETRVDAGEKSFSCDICGKRARNQYSLKTHMRVHTGEKPYACNDCGKSFNRKELLRKHTTIHTEEKPFTCDDCGKRFKRKTHLATHATIHTGEKPFACDDCGKGFKRKTHLATHAAIHTGEKPFGCDDCGKRFKRRTHLMTHVTVHTGEKPFGCAVCGQEFTQPGSLNRHMRFHIV
ncbi:zinc finger protein OZF-like [Mugil cephalus]|uniref:zinc finger protein OZF-like n=1 Tax=Mugil cephalus TaxID=48193 RepID=UPI001FB706CC|nr:zinc finger protein OZF-like [Mugil cephalus]